MKIEKEEIEKIFDFILENERIDLSKDSLINRKTLLDMKNLIKNKKKKYFDFTKEQKQILVDAFLAGNSGFTKNTPKILIETKSCWKEAIKRDIKSCEYIKVKKPNEIEEIKQEALKQKYILNKNSPYYLTISYPVALQSIKQDPNSANAVHWESFHETAASLIEEVINAGYELSENTCPFLAKNKKIVLSSIERNPKTIKYVSGEVTLDSEVFKKIVEKEDDLKLRDILMHPLVDFQDPEIMKKGLLTCVFNKENLSMSNDFSSTEELERYMERIIELYTTAIHTYPTIKPWKDVFNEFGEVDWKYEKTNSPTYNNLFGQICSELKNEEYISIAISNLGDIYRNMELILREEEYEKLIQATIEYHEIIHEKKNLNKLESSRDTISEISAHYVSICKEISKQIENDDLMQYVKKYFILKKTDKICERIILSRQRSKLRNLYLSKDPETMTFINHLIAKYSEKVDKKIIEKMIDSFIIEKKSKLDRIITVPNGVKLYKKALETLKLINRLNSKYIKPTDPDVYRYCDMIVYYTVDGKYHYNGPLFVEQVVKKRWNHYQIKKKIFEEIKRAITNKAKEIEVNKEINNSDLDIYQEEYPFNDKYYEFDQEKFQKEFSFRNLKNGVFNRNKNRNLLPKSSILEDESYENIKNYFINNGLIWLLLFNNKQNNNMFYWYDFSKQEVWNTIKDMDKMIKVAKELNYKHNSYHDYQFLNHLCMGADPNSIAILGTDVILKIIEDRDELIPADEMIRIAVEYMCKRVLRDKSTVPYIKGETDNYKYSMYDPQDETILVTGIDTHSCFAIGNNDNDFLHYCGLDKNGFIIKITDKYDNFIARAAGFRNGNCVYVNQLRTIYDLNRNSYEGIFEHEKAEIIEAFENACIDIVKTSQMNDQEEDKIDFVFVNKSYILKDVNEKNPISVEVEYTIGNCPMERNSIDWKEFALNTKNLTEGKERMEQGEKIKPEDYHYFKTDYGNYSIINVVSTKEKITRRDIIKKDVKAVYNRKRTPISVTKNPDNNMIKKINRISGIDCYQKGEKDTFKEVNIPKNSLVILGDNWYIIYSNNEIVAECVLEDEDARLEYDVTKYILKSGMMEESEKQDTKIMFNELEEIQKDQKKLHRIIRKPSDNH